MLTSIDKTRQALPPLVSGLSELIAAPGGGATGAMVSMAAASAMPMVTSMLEARLDAMTADELDAVLEVIAGTIAGLRSDTAGPLLLAPRDL